jgi:hypothetical protein
MKDEERLKSRTHELTDDQLLSAILCNHIGILCLTRFESRLQELESEVTDPERLQIVQRLRNVTAAQRDGLKQMCKVLFGDMREQQEQSKKMIEFALNGRGPESN